MVNGVMNGMSTETANPSLPTVYSTQTCGFCMRLKQQLDRAGVEYNEVLIDLEPDAAKIVESHNDGMQLVPTVVFPNGTALSNPSVKQVQAVLAGS